MHNQVVAEYQALFRSQISCEGWEYMLEGVPGKTLRTRIIAPTRAAARELVRSYGVALEGIAAKMGCYVGCRETPALFHIQTADQIAQQAQTMTNAPRELYIPEIRITAPLLPVIDEILRTDQSMGLVRLEDERQLSVNGGADGEYLLGASQGHYSQFKRSDYWDAADLLDFQRDSQQRLQPGSDIWTEFKYKVRYPSPGKQLGPSLPPDTLMVNAFRLVDDGLGRMYHLCKNVAWEPIAA